MSTNRFRSCVTVLAIVLPAMLARSAEVKDQIDWEKFLSRHDLVFNRLSGKWGEGAYTGNGLMGAMVYLSDDGKALRFRIGRSDVMVEQKYRVPIGDMMLVPMGKITGGEMRLDLWNAEVRGTLKTDKGEIAFRTYTHAKDLLQVIEIKPSDGEKACAWKFEPGICTNPRNIHNKLEIPENEKNPEPKVKNDAGLHTVVQQYRREGSHATAWKLEKGESADILFVSVGYSGLGDTALRSWGSAIQSVEEGIKVGVSALEQSHRAWWHDFYKASFVSIPDTRLESFYWIQMYKLASATRADCPAIDLMGPWFNDTPWPRIWWNLNIQLTYYPVYTGNHLELGESLCRMIDNGAENLAKNAKEFSADSETIARTSGYDCAGPASRELCNLPWTIHNYYMQYRYSMDDAMLRDRVFPRLKRSINYYFHFLKEEADGKLHITRGYSPEYPTQPEPNPDCNIDLGLLRWGCQTLIDVCARLKIDDPQIPQWKNTLAKLVDYPADENGLRISASQPFAQSHRHYSHLLMIYPLYVMNWDQPENRELITKSLDHWTADRSAFRGYSYTGAASICAEIGRKDDAVKDIHFFVDAKGKYGLLPNGMYTEAGPVIETPLSGARAIQDLLLTSWGGTIRVFPGVPDAWKDVTIDKLRAEGAFLVSAARKDGKTQWIKITSLAGEPCRVKCDMEKPIADGAEMTKNSDGTIGIALRKGESVVLSASADAEMAIAPVAAEEKLVNSFGLP